MEDMHYGLIAIVVVVAVRLAIAAVQRSRR
jgi:hypothetical protein